MMSLVLALATTTVPATESLLPSGKWAIGVQNDACIVTRPFGPGPEPVTLALKPGVALGNGGQSLFLVVPGKAETATTSGRATITLAPTGEQTSIDYVSGMLGTSKLRAFEVYLAPDFLTKWGEASGISVAFDKATFALSTDAMKPVFAALKSCNDDLFRSWKVNPDQLAAPAKNSSPGAWFPQDAYPLAAKQKNAQGRVIIALDVAPNGSPSACRVVVRADPALDETTCRLASKNARFEAGKPNVTRYAVLSVVWTLMGRR